MPYRPVLRTSITVLAICALATLVGCTDSKKGSPAATKSTSAASSAKPTSSPPAADGLPSGVIGATNVPTKVPNVVALRKNVIMSSCKSVPGGWGATGSASNPGSSSQDYTVTVFFTTPHATVIGTAQTQITVPAGGHQSWSVSDKFTAVAGTNCVLRGVG